MSPERIRLLDTGALRALAHPLRQRLLHHLMSFGPRTASECAVVVGASPSNCSYHLRELARFGLVEPCDATDGRERPWRSTATGLRSSAESGPADEAHRAAELSLAQLELASSAELASAALAIWDSRPPDWRAASTLSTYALRMTAPELAALTAQLDALIRPWIGLTRADPPADAEVVHLRLDAFVHPDTP